MEAKLLNDFSVNWHVWVWLKAGFYLSQLVFQKALANINIVMDSLVKIFVKQTGCLQIATGRLIKMTTGSPIISRVFDFTAMPYHADEIFFL